MSKYRIILEGKTYEMEIEKIEDGSVVEPSKTAQEIPRATSNAHGAEQAAGAGAVNSPMPGTIVRLLAREGDTVRCGDIVMILEAMKMENEITAPRDGKIVAMRVRQGDAVQGGTLLFELDG